MRRILLDHCTPVQVGTFFPEHSIDAAGALGWGEFKNGELLRSAEKSRYDLLITSERDFRRDRPRLASPTVAVLLVLPNSWVRIRTKRREIRAAEENLGLGDFGEVSCWS